MACDTPDKTNLDQELSRKTKTLRRLENRLHGYWTKLVEASIEYAKELKIGTYVVERESGQAVHDVTRINVIKDGERVNSEELIGLVKDVKPSLYKRYQHLKKRSNDMRAELEGMVKEYDSMD